MISPLWLYRWVPGIALRIGAITRINAFTSKGETLYGPTK